MKKMSLCIHKNTFNCYSTDTKSKKLNKKDLKERFCAIIYIPKVDDKLKHAYKRYQEKMKDIN